MIIPQLSVFLENKSGRLTEVLDVLGTDNFRITALTLGSPLLTGTLSHADLDIIGAIERRIWGKSIMTEKLGKRVESRSAAHESED